MGFVGRSDALGSSSSSASASPPFVGRFGPGPGPGLVHSFGPSSLAPALAVRRSVCGSERVSIVLVRVGTRGKQGPPSKRFLAIGIFSGRV